MPTAFCGVQVRAGLYFVVTSRCRGSTGVATSGHEVGTIHPLGNFVVNLLDPGNVRYVNCRIEVEVEEASLVRCRI